MVLCNPFPDTSFTVKKKPEIFSWDIVKRSGLGITIMEGCFVIKGMSMIYLQFLKLKIMLFHFTIISVGNTGISSSP